MSTRGAGFSSSVIRRVFSFKMMSRAGLAQPFERIRRYRGDADATGPAPSGTSDGSVFRETTLLAVFLVAFVLLLAHSGWLWRWDVSIYDAALNLSPRSPDPNIIIVAIDEYSLDKVGRWPWPRRVHGRLIERLTAESPSVIGLDVIFAEPDTSDPEGDRVFAHALAENGRTVLPVLAEPLRPGGPLTETLPLPVFAASAAGLGHIHVEVDPDAIARSVFLAEGRGEARWPSLPVAMLRIAQPGRWDELPGLRDRDATSRSWKRAHQVLIPFVGAPGQFRQISYAKVLEGEYGAGLFRDRFVLVGATAAGLSDWLPTPVSGSQRPMPGIEFNANVLDSLLAGLMIRPAAERWRYAANALLVLAVVVLYPFLTPRSGLLAAGLFVVGSLGLSSGLLLAARLWLPLAPAILTTLISYPLWSWRRLECAVGFLRRQSTALRTEHEQLGVIGRSSLGDSLRFIAAVYRIRGWVVRDEDGVRSGWGDPPDPPVSPPARGVWSRHGDQLWTTVYDMGEFRQLGLRWDDFDPGDSGCRDALDQIVRVYRADLPRNPANAIEVVQAQIQQVQEAARLLHSMRDTVDNSLSQMTDGIVVANSLGHIVFANAQASRCFTGGAPAALVDRSLIDVVDRVEITGGTTWKDAVREVLVNRVPMRLNGQHPEGPILLISVAPLVNGDGHITGLIINTSDVTALRESDRRRAEMLGFLSHDLRSPLSSLTTLLNLARLRGLEGSSAEMFARMRGYAETALRLTDQFLALAQAEDIEELQLEDVNLVDVAARAIEQTYAQAQAKEIELQRRFVVSGAWTLGAPELLERAVVNLLTNAMKYSPAQSTVSVCVDRGDGEIHCCVRDEGCGIAESELAKIFNRFERGQRKRDFPESGLGLGLAFVKAVMDRHGGRVEVASAPGRGSRFCLYLTERQRPG